MLYQKKKLQRPKKNLIDEIALLFPVIRILIAFLVDFYAFFDSRDVAGLETFIEKYRGSEIEEVSVFANGLFEDYDAVRNSLIFTEISNGPIEGINNLIKMIKRRSAGRAGIELLNAYAVLTRM